MRKIIVTGATSMLGTALIEVAVENKTEVYALIRKDTKRMDRLVESPFVRVVYGDLTSLKEVNDLPQDCDTFYHFAWAGTNKAERDNPTIQESNIRYTLDAVELAHNCGCKKFIGSGSQAEYGPTDGLIDDDTRFAPATSYGASKHAAGLLSRKLCEKYKMTHIWGRIFSVYGPHDNEGTMLNYAIEQFSKGEEAKFSSATQMWNYLYEKDAGYIFYLLGALINHSDEYRIASDISKPLRDYIVKVAKIMNSEELCVFSGHKDSDAHVYGIETCDNRLFKDIGFHPQVGFDDGIKIIIDSRSSFAGTGY